MVKTLLTADKNVTYNIQAVVESDARLKMRYAELGILAGQNVCIIDKNKHSLLISVRNAIFAIDNNLASKVVVYE